MELLPVSPQIDKEFLDVENGGGNSPEESELHDLQRKPSDDSQRKASDDSQAGSEAGSESIRVSRSGSSQRTEDDRVSLPPETEDHALFHNVTYLGAAAVRSPRSEVEILKNLATMNSETKNQTSVLVDLLIPRVPQGHVVLFEKGTEDEVAKYPVFRIIFCARGGKSSEPPERTERTEHGERIERSERTERVESLSNCFAFTFGHGTNDEAVFLCHAFRCQNEEQVAKIVMCFSSAFRKPVSTQLPQGESVFIFDVCMEIKEDDSRSGSFTACPRESRDCFKMRVNLPKELAIHVLQVNPENPHLSLDKCGGVWLAGGKNVSRSDFRSLPVPSWNNNGKQLNIICPWDPRDEKFVSLNTETPGEHRSSLTVVVDLLVAGFVEPLTFFIHAKARIFPQTEKFWMPGRRQLQETFYLRLSWHTTAGKDPQRGYYSVVSLESQSQREGRCQNIAPLLEQSSSEEEDDSDNEEPLPSGSGQVSRECSEEELKLWSDVLLKLRPNFAQKTQKNEKNEKNEKTQKNEKNEKTQKSEKIQKTNKNLANLIRKTGIPQSLRCEVWQLLSDCPQTEKLLENYKSLSVKNSVWESAISKDITRTFPAHEFFKQTGSEGQDQLFRVIKAFANHDVETGYCQSLSFIAATFLLQMPEEQAFCLLCCVMEDYGMRDMMKSDFDGLRLHFYQLERLLEEKLPDLHYHFRDIGVEMHMFASQWFLTLYTAKFPLFCVFRIIDLFLCDGHNVVFQIAIGLLRMTKNDLLQLDFEAVLKYFRVNLPKKFKNEETVCFLLHQAVNEKINLKKMAIFAKEFQLLQEERNNLETPLLRTKRELREAMETILRLERENDELAHELIHGKIQLRNDLDNAEDQNELQQKEISRLNGLIFDGEDETKRLRHEALLVKELCRKIENENKQQTGVVAEYKRINSQLGERLEKMTSRIDKIQAECCSACQAFFTLDSSDQISSNSTSTSNSNSNSTAENDRITSLELELARTKLALVEKECYTQELEHQLSMGVANQGDQQTKNSWLSKTIKSAAVKTQAALGSVNSANSTSTNSANSNSTNSVNSTSTNSANSNSTNSANSNSTNTAGNGVVPPGGKDLAEKRPSRTDSTTSQ